MRQRRSGLLEEIEVLKAENRTLQYLLHDSQNPELHWWARHNAELILKMSPDEIILSANPATLSLLGFTKEELLGRDLGFLVHPLDLPVIRKVFQECLSDTETERLCHIRGKHFTDDWVWLEATLINQLNNTQLGSVIIVLRVLKMAREVHGQGSLPRVQYYDLFRAIQDALYVSVLHGDGSFGNFIEANEVSSRMLGYSREEFLQMTIKDIDIRFEESEIKQVKHKLTEGESVLFESIHRTKNGLEIPVEIHASLFRFENQRGMISLVRDITERKRGEKEQSQSELLLKESEEHYRTLFSTMDQGVVYQDEQGHIFQANPAAERILCLSFDQMTGRTSVDPQWHAIHEDGSAFPGETHPAMVSLKTGRESSSVMGVYNPQTDTYSWINVNAQAQFKPGAEKPYQVFTTFTDITPLRKNTTDLEKLVQARTLELQAVLNAVPDLLFHIDRSGRFLKSHISETSNLLIPEDQFLGKTMTEILPPEVAGPGMKALEEAFLTKETVYFEYDLTINGELRYFEDRIVALSENEALSIIRDITERKKAEHTLKWNDSLLQKMTATSPLAFFVVDNRDDAILYFNHQFCEIWGITHLEERMRRGELKNNDIIPDCLPVLKDIPSFAESCKPLQDEQNQVVLEDEIPFNDGRTIRRFTAQIRSENDEYFGRLYIFEDITHRTTTEQFIRIQRDLASRHSTMTSMSEALSLALDAMLQIEGVDCGGIYLFDSATSCLDLVAHRGLSAYFISKTSHYGREDPQTAMVENGDTYYLDKAESPLLHEPEMEQDGIISLAILPMQFEGQSIGCINIASKTRSAFYSKNRFSLEALAMQIGGTISRINAETSLKRSQQNFQVLFDTIDDFMFILDAQGLIMRTNPVVRKRLGYTDEELNQLNVLEVHPPERREEAGFIVNEMLAGRASFCPVPLITKEGNLIPVETRVVMGKWDEKDVLFGISRDITERLKAETALKMQSAAFESFSIPIIITDPKAHITWANSAFVKLSGYSQEEILGKSCGELIKSGKHTKEFYRDFWQTIKNGNVWSGEMINRKKDGSLHDEELTVTPVLDQASNISAFIAMKIDLTEKKILEHALRESEARWNVALEGSGDGVWDWNAITNEVFFSTQWKKMLGYADDEIGNTLIEWEKRVHPDDLQQCYADQQKHFSGETDTYVNEHRMLCKDGSYKWILDRGKVVTWIEKGRPLRLIATHSDISQRKKYEEALQTSIEKEKELGKMKTKFLSIASHEFRTPLATILATSESLINYRNKMTENERDKRLQKIKDQVGNINKIIEEILSLSKLQTKEKELEPELFDMTELVLDIIEEFRDQTGRSTDIQFQSTPDHIEVSLDKKNVQLIITNLVSNAVKYSLNEKFIRVELEGAGEEIILRVHDQGIGIPADEINLLFTPFFRASNAGNVSGTGLGLNIVKESVQRHGGKIEIKSKQNEGTSFFITLPRTLNNTSSYEKNSDY